MLLVLFWKMLIIVMIIRLSEDGIWVKMQAKNGEVLSQYVNEIAVILSDTEIEIEKAQKSKGSKERC